MFIPLVDVTPIGPQDFSSVTTALTNQISVSTIVAVIALLLSFSLFANMHYTFSDSLTHAFFNVSSLVSSIAESKESSTFFFFFLAVAFWSSISISKPVSLEARRTF